MTNRIGLAEPDWAYIGAVLGRADDNAQAEFFKSFVKECLSWGTAMQVERQLCFVNGKLTAKEKDTLGMLVYKDQAE